MILLLVRTRLFGSAHSIFPFINSPLGTYQESMYSLMCLGIPIHGFPVKEAGFLDLTNLHRWLQHRWAVEGTHQTRKVCAKISRLTEHTDLLPRQPGCDITDIRDTRSKHSCDLRSTHSIYQGRVR